MRVITLIAMVALMAVAGSGVAAKKRFVLFTPEQAAKLNISAAEKQEIKAQLAQSKETGAFNNSQLASAAIKKPPGPSIIIKKPGLKQDGDDWVLETHSPADLIVEFAGNGADVDISTLEVEASKFLFSISLTDELQEFIDKNALVAKNIDIPEGEYKITIHIEDKQGRVTEQSYYLRVT